MTEQPPLGGVWGGLLWLGLLRSQGTWRHNQRLEQKAGSQQKGADERRSGQQSWGLTRSPGQVLEASAGEGCPRTQTA